ncbi:phenylacetate--CoA ligase family protein [Streptomyces sp. NPDC051644]|uniref:phenylacetate--CoA ligase family protein n=1 Tax=Streptomyces sp. NPDC051644 TaxID=3365666 RepID=UPI0037A4100D
MDVIRDRMIAGQSSILGVYNFLEENESLSAEQLAARQRHLMRAQLEFARQESPYFANILRHHPTDDLLNSPERWADLPFMDKSVLLKNFDMVRTRTDISFRHVAQYLSDRSLVDEPFNGSGLLVVSTAGTSGKPGYFVYDPREQAHIRAQYFRFMRAILAGIKPQGPLRSAAIIVTGAHMIGYKMQQHLPPEFFRMIPVLREGRAVTVEETAAELADFNPQVLTCFGSTLRMLTEYKEANPDFSWRPLALINTGATLEQDVQRRALAAFEGVRIFDLYGSTDTGYIGWTCEQGSMHLNTDCMRIEILDEDNRPVADGEFGSIVISTYWHRTLPIIRYRLGDLMSVSTGGCACGRNLPVVKELLGRENTLLYRRAETGVAPVPQGVFMEMFETISGVRRFRLVQETLDRVTVSVVPLPDSAPGLAERVAERVTPVFGEGASVDVRIVDALVPPASGKLLPVERLFDPAAERAGLR